MAKIPSIIPDFLQFPHSEPPIYELSQYHILLSTMSAIAGSSKSANEMYEIRDVGKKGKGMVAAKDISQGEIILSEKPILVVLAHGLCPAVVYNEYLTLNESDRARFRALSFNADSNTLMAYAKDLGNQHDKERGKIIAIFNTNCMEDQEHTKRYVAVECARMNHSCRPNTTYGYVHKDNVVIVRALQGIAKGDEIVIPYVPPIWTKKQRTEKLWSDWHFVCDCDACTSKTPGPLLSDKVSNELIAVDVCLCVIAVPGLLLRLTTLT